MAEKSRLERRQQARLPAPRSRSYAPFCLPENPAAMSNLCRVSRQMHDLRPAPDGPGDVVFDGEYEFSAQYPRFRQNGGERGVEQVNAPIAAAAGRVRI